MSGPACLATACWHAALTWLCRSGALRAAGLVVGVPCITSPGNLRFWLRLCGVCEQDADAAAELQQLETAAGKGPQALQDHCWAWNLALMARVAQLPGRAGAHLMPVTRRGQDMLLQMLDQHLVPL